MNKYPITLEWSEEDLAWIATAPNLPGCMADGSTQEEALQQIQLVIDMWIDEAQRLGRSIPTAPPSIDDVIKASKLLNKSELARLLGMQSRTLNAKIQRRTPLTHEESLKLQQTIKENGLIFA